MKQVGRGEITHTGKSKIFCPDMGFPPPRVPKMGNNEDRLKKTIGDPWAGQAGWLQGTTSPLTQPHEATNSRQMANTMCCEANVPKTQHSGREGAAGEHTTRLALQSRHNKFGNALFTGCYSDCLGDTGSMDDKFSVFHP